MLDPALQKLTRAGIEDGYKTAISNLFAALENKLIDLDRNGSDIVPEELFSKDVDYCIRAYNIGMAELAKRQKG